MTKILCHFDFMGMRGFPPEKEFEIFKGKVITALDREMSEIKVDEIIDLKFTSNPYAFTETSYDFFVIDYGSSGLSSGIYSSLAKVLCKTIQENPSKFYYIISQLSFAKSELLKKVGWSKSYNKILLRQNITSYVIEEMRKTFNFEEKNYNVIFHFIVFIQTLKTMINKKEIN